jgi:hypothetical protein
MAKGNRNKLLDIIAITVSAIGVTIAVLSIWISSVNTDVRDLALSNKAYAERIATLESDRIADVKEVKEIKASLCTLNNRVIQILVKLKITPAPEIQITEIDQKK